MLSDKIPLKCVILTIYCFEYKYCLPTCKFIILQSVKFAAFTWKGFSLKQKENKDRSLNSLKTICDSSRRHEQAQGEAWGACSLIKSWEVKDLKPFHRFLHVQGVCHLVSKVIKLQTRDHWSTQTYVWKTLGAFLWEDPD